MFQKLGMDALRPLRRALEESKSAEVRQREQALLGKINVPLAMSSPERRQQQAALYVLELIATDDARRVLNDVAAGKSGVLLAEEAEAALKRLKKK